MSDLIFDDNGFIPLQDLADTVVARNLYRLMRERGWPSMTSLSLVCGSNRSLVENILKGKSIRPRDETLRKLAAALGCEIKDLLNEPEAILGTTPLDPRLFRLAMNAVARLASSDAGETPDDRQERIIYYAQRLCEPLQRYQASG